VKSVSRRQEGRGAGGGFLKIEQSTVKGISPPEGHQGKEFSVPCRRGEKKGELLETVIKSLRKRTRAKSLRLRGGTTYLSLEGTSHYYAKEV